MKMSLDYLLVAIYSLLLLTAVLSIIANGVILLTVIKNPPLRKKDCLYLISALAVADFLTAWGNLPYAVDLLAKMSETCTQIGLAVLFSQNLAGARMNQIITLCLGLDRLYAVFRPVQYRAKNHLKFAQFVAASSFVLGFVDAGTYLLQQHQEQQQYQSDSLNCSVIAYPTKLSTFSLQTFRLFSNLTINITTEIIHIVMYWKVRRLTMENINEESRHNFRQANETIALILLASFLFVTIPCIVQVFDYFIGAAFFQKYSAILNIGCNLNGAINAVSYAWKHRDFHNGMVRLCTCSTNKISLQHQPNHLDRLPAPIHDNMERVLRPIGRHLDVPRERHLAGYEDPILVSM